MLMLGCWKIGWRVGEVRVLEIRDFFGINVSVFWLKVRFGSSLGNIYLSSIDNCWIIMGSLGLFVGMVDFFYYINCKSKVCYFFLLKDIIKFMGFEGMISLVGGEIVVYDDG